MISRPGEWFWCSSPSLIEEEEPRRSYQCQQQAERKRPTEDRPFSSSSEDTEATFVTPKRTGSRLSGLRISPGGVTILDDHDFSSSILSPVHLDKLSRLALPFAIREGNWRRIFTAAKGTTTLVKFQKALKTTSKIALVVIRTDRSKVFGGLLCAENDRLDAMENSNVWSRDSCLFEIIKSEDFSSSSVLVHRWGGGNDHPTIVQNGNRHWAMGLPNFGLRLIGPDLQRGTSESCATFGNSMPLGGQAEFFIEYIEIWGLYTTSSHPMSHSPQIQFVRTPADSPLPPFNLNSTNNSNILVLRTRCLSTLN